MTAHHQLEPVVLQELLGDVGTKLQPNTTLAVLQASATRPRRRKVKRKHKKTNRPPLSDSDSDLSGMPISSCVAGRCAGPCLQKEVHVLHTHKQPSPAVFCSPAAPVQAPGHSTSSHTSGQHQEAPCTHVWVCACEQRRGCQQLQQAGAVLPSVGCVRQHCLCPKPCLLCAVTNPAHCHPRCTPTPRPLQPLLLLPPPAAALAHSLGPALVP